MKSDLASAEGFMGRWRVFQGDLVDI